MLWKRGEKSELIKLNCQKMWSVPPQPDKPLKDTQTSLLMRWVTSLSYKVGTRPRACWVFGMVFGSASSERTEGAGPRVQHAGSKGWHLGCGLGESDQKSAWAGVLPTEPEGNTFHSCPATLSVWWWWEINKKANNASLPTTPKGKTKPLILKRFSTSWFLLGIFEA